MYGSGELNLLVLVLWFAREYSHHQSTATTIKFNWTRGWERDRSVGSIENGMFAVEGGPRPYKWSNKSFLFG
jgi:hypothetical protein